MASDDKSIEKRSGKTDVAAFLEKLALTPGPVHSGARRGRLIFALDATASREPAWDRAAQIQSEMFRSVEDLGGLDVQLCYYRGFQEFEALPWGRDARELRRRMTRVFCAAGYTQIVAVLRHALEETRRSKVDAVVFVGDCVEESRGEIAGLAGQLGILGTPAFVFQEGLDPAAESVFREIAALSHGAYSRFDAHSPDQLRDLLSAVAVFAAGGMRALQDFAKRRGGSILRLTHQIRKE